MIHHDNGAFLELRGGPGVFVFDRHEFPLADFEPAEPAPSLCANPLCFNGRRARSVYCAESCRVKWVQRRNPAIRARHQRKTRARRNAWKRDDYQKNRDQVLAAQRRNYHRRKESA